jgi:hypothetical protein
MEQIRLSRVYIPSATHEIPNYDESKISLPFSLVG